MSMPPVDGANSVDDASKELAALGVGVVVKRGWRVLV
jgi:hypothetical protein